MLRRNEYLWALAAKSHRHTRLSRLAWVGLLLAALLSSANAQESYRGSQADQQACMDDVYRLCNQFVPDEQRIVACLAQNQRNLSPACRAVFSHGPGGGNQRSEDGNTRRQL